LKSEFQQLYQKLLPPLVANIRKAVTAWRTADCANPPHIYAKARQYTVAVKVIDIFGNDTMALVPVHVG
jgi:hypothetical protein